MTRLEVAQIEARVRIEERTRVRMYAKLDRQGLIIACICMIPWVTPVIWFCFAVLKYTLTH